MREEGLREGEDHIDVRTAGSPLNSTPLTLLGRLRSRLGDLRRLSVHTGRPRISILADLIRCRRDGFLPFEYLIYKFYEPGRMELRQDFGGISLSGTLNAQLNDEKRWVLVDDKLVCQERLARRGIPTPPTVALLTSRPRTTPSAPTLREPAEIRDFFEQVRFPLFMKPIADGQGHGCCRIDSWDGTRAETSAGKLTLPDLIQLSQRPVMVGDPGLLLSRVVEPHRLLSALHRSLSTVRLCVLVTPEGPVVVRAALKIPVGGEVIDNFNPFQGFNIAAHVDPDSGLVGRAVSGFGLTETRHEKHPDSGAPIEGLRLPHWKDVLEHVTSGALLFPGLRYQHWDVAISDSGPVVIEINQRGGLQLLQQPTLQPFLDQRVRGLLRAAQRAQ